VNIFEVVMTETLEILLWCAALATWLMLLFAFREQRPETAPKEHPPSDPGSFQGQREVISGLRCPTEAEPACLGDEDQHRASHDREILQEPLR
jgi:hypothetical protein